MAVTARARNVVELYRQTALGVFSTTPVGTYTTGTAPSSLIATTLGRLVTQSDYVLDDLVAVSGPSNQLSFFVNNNDAQGTMTVATPAGFYPSSWWSTDPKLVAAYIDTDQFLDVAYTHDAARTDDLGIGVWRGQGSPSIRRTTFLMTTRTGVPALPSFYDMDGDGGLDLITVDKTNNAAVAHYYTFGQFWYNMQDGAGVLCQSGQAVSAASADLNADSRGDFAVATANPNKVEVWLNTGVDRFGSLATYALPSAPQQVLLADLNKDSYPDMVVLLANGNVTIFPHTGQSGAGRYGTPQVLPVGPTPGPLRMADVDNDTYQDLYVACAGNDKVYILRNVGRPLATKRTAQLAGTYIYPNPATSVVRVTRPANLVGPLTDSLFDATGRQVLQQVIASTGTLLVSQLPRGIYTLKVNHVTGVSTSRLVLQ
ncbi:hypothetical protein GCM10028821_28190 [Hymenobacter jeollabukensis]